MKRVFVPFVLSILLFVTALPVLAGSGLAAPPRRWRPVYPPVSPPPRTDHAMAYDTKRGVAVLFGGTAEGVEFNDTWEWESRARTWVERKTEHQPEGRYGHAFDIAVDDGTLKARFVYPDPDGPVDILPESLSGVAMTTGFSGDYTNLTSQAVDMAERCAVVLIYNYRGQGDPTDINTEFNFYDPTTAHNDLEDVTAVLKEGPLPLTLDLVDDMRLGMLGFSQAGFVTWLVVADPTFRGQYRAVAPTMVFPS